MYYIEINNNPNNVTTGDCAVRAISLALDKTWKEVYKELTKEGLKSGFIMNDKKNIENYLKQIGFVKEIIRRKDNTKYTVEEFCDELAKKDETYIVTITQHVTLIKNKTLFDTWNCADNLINNIWIKNKERKNGATK